MYALSAFTHLPPITLGSLAFILLIFLILLATYSEKTADSGPAILTTTGIFCTFLGISIGLLEFDVSNIQASVPALLDGLKTAFLASVTGVGGALILKARQYIWGVPARKDGTPAAGATVDDLASSLRDIHRALAGDGDATLVSQLKLLRQDSNDRLDALKKAQTDALQMLSQMGSKALVEALRDVIRDFNARINEQFGENFKHLNDGVAKLLVWQEQHRQHVDTMANRLEDMLKIAQATAGTQKQVVEQSSAFSEIAYNLSDLLSVLNTQTIEINSYVESPCC
jgi:methyl-accepting chemotaxis protein